MPGPQVSLASDPGRCVRTEVGEARGQVFTHAQQDPSSWLARGTCDRMWSCCPHAQLAMSVSSPVRVSRAWQLPPGRNVQNAPPTRTRYRAQESTCPPPPLMPEAFRPLTATTEVSSFHESHFERLGLCLERPPESSRWVSHP